MCDTMKRRQGKEHTVKFVGDVLLWMCSWKLPVNVKKNTQKQTNEISAHLKLWKCKLL